jgi:ATP-dependent DNA helicase RecQ
MALTATASNNMRKDIVKNLKLRDPFVSIASFNCPNLHYYVRKKDGKSIQAR